MPIFNLLKTRIGVWITIGALLTGIVFLIFNIVPSANLEDQTTKTTSISSQTITLPLIQSVVRDFCFNENDQSIFILKKSDGSVVLEEMTKNKKWQTKKTTPIFQLSGAQKLICSPDFNKFIITNQTEDTTMSFLVDQNYQIKELPKNISHIVWQDNQSILYSYQNQNLSQMNTVDGKWSKIKDITYITDIKIINNLIFIARSSDLDEPDQIQVLDASNYSRKQLSINAFVVSPSLRTFVAFPDFEPEYDLEKSLSINIYNTDFDERYSIKGDFDNIKWISVNELKTIYQGGKTKLKIITYQLLASRALELNSKEISKFNYGLIGKIEYTKDDQSVFILDLSSNLYEIML